MVMGIRIMSPGISPLSAFPRPKPFIQREWARLADKKGGLERAGGVSLVLMSKGDGEK